MSRPTRSSRLTHRNSWKLAGVGFPALMLATFPAPHLAAQQTITESAQLIPGGSDIGIGDEYSRSVAVDGDVAVFGAYRHGISDTGAAYVFRYDGNSWVEEQKLTASDPMVGHRFGYDVAVCDNVIVVGAHGDLDGTGAAYVFRFSSGTWLQEQKLVSDDGSPSDNFGHAVAIDENVVVAGARFEDNANGIDAGAAYVFRYNEGSMSWSQEQKLVASDGFLDDEFGEDVDIDSGVIIVGAWLHDLPGQNNAGRAYLFRYDLLLLSWQEEAAISPSVIPGDEHFGSAVSVNGDTAAVGADFAFGGLGRVLVFRRLEGTQSDWQEEAVLTVEEDGFPTNTEDYFGNALALDGNTLVVGAVGEDIGFGFIQVGACYRYCYDGSQWRLTRKLVQSVRSSNDNFGASLSVSGDFTMVGAPFVGADRGRAYFFISNDLRIDHTSPSAGPFSGGTEITLTGMGFTPDTSVFFGTQPAVSVTFVDESTLQAVVPPFATPAQPMMSKRRFQVVQAAADVTVVEPSACARTLPSGYMYRR